MKRRQVSAYLRGVPELEALRQRFNPMQARLIPAHVTLCREDEVHDWVALAQRIEASLPLRWSMSFGGPVRDGDMAYLPVVEGRDTFDALRERWLGGFGEKVRKHDPHVTLIHPRNGQCTEAILAELESRLKPFTIEFREVLVIEQNEGGPWEVVQAFGESA